MLLAAGPASAASGSGPTPGCARCYFFAVSFVAFIVEVTCLN